MKSATLPRAEDKQTVRRALSTSNILYAAVGRLYVSYSHNPEWIYSGVWGAVAFCKDRSKNGSYFIRIVDMENERGVIWEQELYNGFEYIKDCSYFHTFDTDDYFAGILFVHQGEANAYHDLVIGRDTVKLKNNTPKSTFGRVGYSKEHGFTVDNNDPEIIAILKELEKSGDFSPADIIANQEFIQEFIIQYQANNQKQTSKSKLYLFIRPIL
ncbi:hypothetical protein BDB01DRAFT_11242 [Pilobolus umbonatus]|nr:hypothetical protein BDB01DRAFT_11242 [Pilobolus umbonatus]